MAIIKVQNLDGAAPAVALPATGVDPTAAATPALSAADQALVASVQVVLPEGVTPAAAPQGNVVGTAQTSESATATAGDAATSAAPVTGDAGNVGSPDAAAQAVAAVPVGASAAQPSSSAGDAVPVELTPSQKLQQKIDAKTKQRDNLTAEIERLTAQLSTIDLLDGVQAGSVLTARVGRAETAKEVNAVVTGVQTLDNGDKRYKIYFGEGFDAETVVIQSTQIVSVTSNPA